MLHSPRTTARHHQSPRGSVRRNASSTRPAGRARTVAANSGRSGGSSCSVTTYVEPQAIGATAVTRRVPRRVSSMEEIISSVEGIIKGMAEQTDAVDRIVAQWARERPDLDSSPMAVIGRLHRVAALLEAELRPVFAEAGLGNGDFGGLAWLGWAGAPYRLSPSELIASTMVTSGAVTKRVDRLAARGLVTRSVSAEDGRGRLVALTPEGLRLTDELVVRHWANEDRLLAALGGSEREALADLLRTLLVDLEGPDAGPVDAG